MATISTLRWKSLENQSPILFLVAGALLVGYAVLNGVEAFTDMAYVAVEDVLGPAGFTLGFVGLLGLYPMLADRSPRLVRAGAVCIALGVVGFSAITLQGLVVLTGAEPPGETVVFILLVTIGMIPGYLSFGVASLRTDVQSQRVGFLLFVPAVVYASMLFQAILFTQFGELSSATMAWSAFAISTAQAVAHLAIGYSLWLGTASNEREVLPGDVTTG